MTQTGEEEVKRGRGRPPKLTQTEEPQEPKQRGPQKIKLKPSPKYTTKDYYKKYGHEKTVCIYGVNEFTEELVMKLWAHPEMSFICTDPNQDKLANLNRKMSGLSFSMYRWQVTSCQGFIEEPRGSIIVTTKDYEADLKSRPNPYNAEIVVIEDI